MRKATNNPKNIKPKNELIDEFSDSLKSLTDKIDAFVYPLIIPPRESINEDILFNIYPDLRSIGKQNKLHVLLYSYGGDAHTAFHIGRLLQNYAIKELKIYILREAKSAATLMAMAADTIVFTEISELGPMDPQIAHPKIDKRFSPLDIKHTLDLLHSELLAEHSGVVSALADKLPDPITLGGAIKSLETGKDYIYKLLKARMFQSADDEEIKTIANTLVVGYPDHGYCIDFKEAKDIGLNVEKVSSDIETDVFNLMKNFKNIWDKFEFLFTKSKDASSQEFKDALNLVVGLRHATQEIVEEQVKSANKRTPKEGETSNNRNVKKSTNVSSRRKNG